MAAATKVNKVFLIGIMGLLIYALLLALRAAPVNLLLPHPSQITVVNEHTLVKHATAVTAIEQCFSGGGTLRANLVHPSGRRAQICEFDGKWFVSITEADGEPVTAMQKEKMHTLRQVLRYLENRGYFIPD